MSALTKKIGAGVITVLIAIQIIRPAKNSSSAAAGPNDITTLHTTSPEVKAILSKACYDCHSDNTRYPWYAEVQPVSWWLANHVKDGKRHLNFSQFGSYTAKRASKRMKDVIEQTKSREMPMASYTLVHRDAKLTDEEIATLGAWAQSVRAQLPAQ